MFDLSNSEESHNSPKYSQGHNKGLDPPPGQQSEGCSKNGGDKGPSGISRPLGAEKLQSAPGTDNPCYAVEIQYEMIKVKFLNSNTDHFRHQ